MRRTFFATEEMKHKINALRMEEYGKASGFTVDLQTLAWKDSDRESFVMVTQEEDKIIATMRGELIEDLSTLEKKLECPWNYSLALTFPVLLLSRAATDSAHRSRGLNLIQRYWFLKLAQHHGIPFILGTFVSESPREKTLRAMGYEFFDNPFGWQQSTYRSHRNVKVVALNMKDKGDWALKYCEGHFNTEEFPFFGDMPEKKIVRSI